MGPDFVIQPLTSRLLLFASGIQVRATLLVEAGAELLERAHGFKARCTWHPSQLQTSQLTGQPGASHFLPIFGAADVL
jgi:hypothetical protein